MTWFGASRRARTIARPIPASPGRMSSTKSTVGEFRYGLGPASHARQHRRRQRHADRPLREFAGLGLDHRQCRQLPHRSRADRSPVRLQRLAALREPSSVQGRHRPALPASRRSRRELRPRLLVVQCELRRHGVLLVLCGDARWLCRQLSGRVGPVLPRESHEGIQRLRRGQLARRLEPDAQPGSALRVRRSAEREGRPARLRLWR